MIRNLLFQNRIIELLLLSYFIFLIVYPVASIISFITLTVYFVFSGKMKLSFQYIVGDTGIKIFIGYYLLHVIGILYSSNMNYGFNDLQTKLTFILIPLVYCGLNISEKIFDNIKIAFIISCAISLLYLLSLSAIKFSSSADWNEFFYTRLSHATHSTYISIYFSLCLLFIQELYFRIKKRFSNVIYVVIYYFLFIGILLLSARTSIFATLITTAVFPFLLLRKNVSLQIHYKTVILNIVLMFVILLVYLQFYNRFTQVEQAIVAIEKENSFEVDSTAIAHANSTNIRFHTWQNAVELISENPFFGVGTGDLKEELVNKYAENNYQYGVRERTSPHNQFLHTGVILGLTGVGVLLAYLLIPLFISFRQKDWLYFFFLIIILLNCMTESILEREAGILFFTAFNTWFYLRLLNKQVNIIS